jgi:hypothetical protein
MMKYGTVAMIWPWESKYMEFFSLCLNFSVGRLFLKLGGYYLLVDMKIGAVI